MKYCKNGLLIVTVTEMTKLTLVNLLNVDLSMQRKKNMVYMIFLKECKFYQPYTVFFKVALYSNFAHFYPKNAHF